MKLIPALFVTFLVLKLTGVIDWSWWLITAPLWGSAILILIIAILVTVSPFWAYIFSRSSDGG